MRERILLILIMVFLFSSLAYADSKTITKHYRLDTGVVFIWSNSDGIWQSGNEPYSEYNGTTELVLYTPDVTDSIENVEALPYTLTMFPDDYSFNDNPVFHWNSTLYADDQTSYREFYFHNGLTSLITTGTPVIDKSTRKVQFTWKGLLDSNNHSPINVKEFLGNKQIADIYAMMGSVK